MHFPAQNLATHCMGMDSRLMIMGDNKTLGMDESEK